MSYRTLALFLSAVAFAGCGRNDDNNGSGGNSGGNDGTSGCEPNCDDTENAFAATIQADVGWTTGNFTIDGDEIDDCSSTSSCTTTVDQANLYEVDFENSHGFVTKLVDVNDETTFAVTWDEPGDWSVFASGLYEDQYGREVEVQVSEYDFDDDGDDERVIGGDDFAFDVIFSGDTFTGSGEDDGFTVDIEGWFDGTAGYYLASYSDGRVAEFDYELIETYTEE